MSFGELKDLLGPKNYFLMLGSSLALILTAPFLDDTNWGRAIMGILMLVVLGAAGIVASQSKRSSYLTLALSILTTLMWIVMITIAHYGHVNQNIQIATLMITLLFLLVTMIIMLQDIFRGQVTTNRLCGAVCIYFLIGICFAIIQLMILSFNPHSIRVDPHLLSPLADPTNFQSFGRLSLVFYYSFVTLATLGYGDITPIGAASRTFAWLEAILGQVYLSLMVARLVGLHIVTHESKPID